MRFSQPLVIVLFAVALCLPSPADARELGRSSIGNLKVTEAADGESVRVSGEDLESAWPITKVTVRKKKDEIVIRVYATILPNRHAKGHFDDTVRITPDVKRIVFGKSGDIIWDRSATFSTPGNSN